MSVPGQLMYKVWKGKEVGSTFLRIVMALNCRVKAKSSHAFLQTHL